MNDKTYKMQESWNEQNVPGVTSHASCSALHILVFSVSGEELITLSRDKVHIEEEIWKS